MLRARRHLSRVHIVKKIWQQNRLIRPDPVITNPVLSVLTAVIVLRPITILTSFQCIGISHHHAQDVEPPLYVWLMIFIALSSRTQLTVLESAQYLHLNMSTWNYRSSKSAKPPRSPKSAKSIGHKIYAHVEHAQSGTHTPGKNTASCPVAHVGQYRSCKSE